MKCTVTGHNQINLEPENDADQALLNYWSECVARSDSSGFQDGRTTNVAIGFKPREQDTKP